MMHGFSNKKCMKRIHSKRADVSNKNEENSTLMKNSRRREQTFLKNEENSTRASDSYERKDSSKEKRKAALSRGWFCNWLQSRATQLRE